MLSGLFTIELYITYYVTLALTMKISTLLPKI